MRLLALALALTLALVGCASPSAAPHDPAFAAWFVDAPAAFYDVARLDVAVKSLEPNGGVAGTRSVCITDDGATMGCQDVSLVPGETKVIVFLQRNLPQGEHVFRALNATLPARVAPTPLVGDWILGPRADVQVAHVGDAWIARLRAHGDPPPIVEVRWRAGDERVRLVGETTTLPAPTNPLSDSLDAFVQDGDGTTYTANDGLPYRWVLPSTGS